MKNPILRLTLTVLLLLTLVLSAVSCGNNPDPGKEETKAQTEAEATKDPAKEASNESSNETEAATEPETEAETHPVTEAITEAATEKPKTPAEPVTYKMADGTVFTFQPVLPDRFGKEGAIRIDGGSYDGNGVHALEVSGLTHYYLDTGGTTYVDAEGNKLSKGNYYMSYTFEVPEDGEYEFCFDMRMKDTKHRYNLISFDEGEQTLMEFELSDKQVEDARDEETVGSFMTGFFVNLTSGYHTVTMKISEEHGASFHFRNLYLVKAE